MESVKNASKQIGSVNAWTKVGPSRGGPRLRQIGVKFA